MDAELLLRVVVHDPPAGVAFQMQRGKQDLVPAVRRTARELVFEFPLRIGNSGTLAGQFPSVWSRRAKLPLTAITWDLVEKSRRANAALETHMPGTGRDGGPTCASVKLTAPAWRVVLR